MLQSVMSKTVYLIVMIPTAIQPLAWDFRYKGEDVLVTEILN